MCTETILPGEYIVAEVSSTVWGILQKGLEFLIKHQPCLMMGVQMSPIGASSLFLLCVERI